MKNRISRKLRSRTGASILFALLLFLVCAVLASVALTAATASSGRMSEIAKSDQRYYAVTSAAELMKTLIDGKSVTITKITVVEVETDDTLQSTETTTTDYDSIVESILNSAKDHYMNETDSSNPEEYELSFAVESSGDHSLDHSVMIYAYYSKFGKITLHVERDDYVLALEFEADADKQTKEESITIVKDDTSKQVTRTEESTRITWKLSNIETGA